VLCLMGSEVFSKVETAWAAAARLTGFFFIERCGWIPLKAVGARVQYTHSVRTICVILSVRIKLGEPKVQFEGSLPLAATTNLGGKFLCFKKSPNKYIISCSLRRKDSSHR